MTAITQNKIETERSSIENEARHGRPISEAVVIALAAAEGVEPNELSPRLYDSLDPDALDDLYESASERDGNLQLVFTLDEHEVVIENGRQVSVRDP